MLSRTEIAARLKELANGRYEDRETVSEHNAFEAFGRLNRQACTLYDKLDELAVEVLQ